VVVICPSCQTKFASPLRFCTCCGYRFVVDRPEPRVAETARDLVEGTTVREVLVGGAIFWRRALELLEEICGAVAESKARGIANPELAPEKIYIDHELGNRRRVKLADVSISLMRGNEPRDTAIGYQPSDKYGRPMPGLDYMSPEQLMGKALGPATDVYTLGVVAYELLTGGRPFPDAKGPAGLITAQLKKTPAAPSTFVTDIPPAVDTLVLRCLHKLPAERYADATILANEIAEVLQTGRLPNDESPNVS
jgi:serine/threonine-protein kinase